MRARRNPCEITSTGGSLFGVEVLALGIPREITSTAGSLFGVEVLALGIPREITSTAGPSTGAIVHRSPGRGARPQPVTELHHPPASSSTMTG